MARFLNLRVFRTLMASRIVGGADDLNGNLELDAKGGSSIVVNEQSRNVDFRVESNSITDIIFVDASADRLYLRNLLYRDVITSVTTSYSILATDALLSVKTSNGAITLTLPALGTPGKRFLIKDAEGYANDYNVTINAATGELIDGAQGIVIDWSWGAIELIDDTSRWIITRILSSQI